MHQKPWNWNSRSRPLQLVDLGGFSPVDGVETNLQGRELDGGNGLSSGWRGARGCHVIDVEDETLDRYTLGGEHHPSRLSLLTPLITLVRRWAVARGAD